MFDKHKEWVMVSHPLTDNIELRRKQVDKICKEVLAEGKIPVSPLHLFGYMENDNERKQIMAICKRLITMCAEHNEGVCVYFYDYGKLSEGQMEEYTYCFNNKYKTEFREVE